MTGIEACFIGRLGRDAELRMVKGGSLAMVSFSAAVDGKDADPDDPTWIRCVAFGEIAEQLAQRLVKGVRVYVEGKLSVDLWEPGTGAHRGSTSMSPRPLRSPSTRSGGDGLARLRGSTSGRGMHRRRSTTNPIWRSPISRGAGDERRALLPTDARVSAPKAAARSACERAARGAAHAARSVHGHSEHGPVYEKVDRDLHPDGWGYNLVRFVSLDEAWDLPIEGQA